MLFYSCLLLLDRCILEIRLRRFFVFDNLASPKLVTDEAFQLIICALLLAKYGDAILNLERKTGDIKQ